ncbi:uncharacterized protein METZ01_LOCUS250423, partial [marine metagenome]
IDFAEPFTLDEMEEVLGECRNNDFLEGRRTHFYKETDSILEFVPEGFALDQDIKDEDESNKKEEDYSDVETESVETSVKEEAQMVQTEDLKWEEEEREEEPPPYEDEAAPEEPPQEK